MGQRSRRTGPWEPWEGAVSQGGVQRLESCSWDFTGASPVPAWRAFLTVPDVSKSDCVTWWYLNSQEMRHICIQISFFKHITLCCIRRGVESADYSVSFPQRITESVGSVFTVYQHRSPEDHYIKLDLFRPVSSFAMFCSILGSVLKMEPLSHLWLPA